MIGRPTAALTLAFLVGAAAQAGAEEDDAPTTAPPPPTPAGIWHGLLQPSFWLGGTDAAGMPDQSGTGEAMVRLELGIQREPAETGLTVGFGLPASLRYSFAGTNDGDSPLGTFRLGVGGALGNRFRRGGDFPQAWDIQVIASTTLDEGERQPGGSVALRLRGESAFFAVEATAVREAFDAGAWDHGVQVGFGLPRAGGNRAGMVMLGLAALTGVALVALVAITQPNFD